MEVIVNAVVLSTDRAHHHSAPPEKKATLESVLEAERDSIASKGPAGEGNRTLVSSLGSWRSTIELHPRNEELNSDR